MLSNLPQRQANAEEAYQELYDYVSLLRREFEDAIYNLDSDNISELNATVIRTAISGARIELAYNGITSYNDANQLHGIVYDPASANARFRLYYQGENYLEAAKFTGAGGLYLSSYGQGMLMYNNAFGYTQPLGVWDFSMCTGVYGLEDKGYATKEWVEENFAPL